MAAVLATGHDPASTTPPASRRSSTSPRCSSRWAPGSSGAGTSTIEVEGVDALHPTEHARRARPDRRRHAGRSPRPRPAATSRSSAAGAEHLASSLDKLADAGATVTSTPDGFRVVGPAGRAAVGRRRDAALPRVPDRPAAVRAGLQRGRRRQRHDHREPVRGAVPHVQELARLGADARIDGHHVMVHGVDAAVRRAGRGQRHPRRRRAGARRAGRRRGHHGAAARTTSTAATPGSASSCRGSGADVTREPDDDPVRLSRCTGSSRVVTDRRVAASLVGRRRGTTRSPGTFSRDVHLRRRHAGPCARGVAREEPTAGADRSTRWHCSDSDRTGRVVETVPRPGGRDRRTASTCTLGGRSALAAARRDRPRRRRPVRSTSADVEIGDATGLGVLRRVPTTAPAARVVASCSSSISPALPGCCAPLACTACFAPGPWRPTGAGHCGASHRLRTCPGGLPAGTVHRLMPDDVAFLARRGAPQERDRPWVMRTYAGHSSAAASNALYRTQPGQGPDRPVGRLRPADPDRLRPRPPARPRRGRQGRRAGPPHRRHAGAVRRHPARRDEHLDDDQRHRDVAARALPGRRRGARAPTSRSSGRHDAERHHQGVPLPRDLRLPARPVAAADHRHGRLHGHARCRSGTRSTSAATTCRRRARRRCRRSPTRCRTAIAVLDAVRDSGQVPPERLRRGGRAGSRSSSTPACGSSRRCARCAPSRSSGTS